MYGSAPETDRMAEKLKRRKSKQNEPLYAGIYPGGGIGDYWSISTSSGVHEKSQPSTASSLVVCAPVRPEYEELEMISDDRSFD